jgi:hypothetical protein
LHEDDPTKSVELVLRFEDTKALRLLLDQDKKNIIVLRPEAVFVFGYKTKVRFFDFV